MIHKEATPTEIAYDYIKTLKLLNQCVKSRVQRFCCSDLKLFPEFIPLLLYHMIVKNFQKTGYLS